MVIGDSVTDIYSYAFHGCTSLRNVEMGAGLENIGNYAFDGCTSLADITLGDNVKAVGSYAFQNCSVLVNVDLNSKLEILGSYCFMNCTSLSFIEIPSSVKTIDIGAFYGCSVLKRVLFNEGLEVIEGRAFYGCPLNSIVIPDSVIFINSYCTDTVYGWYDGAFENCRQLRNVVLGSGLRKIDYDAFYGCTSLESVVIGDSVTEIKDYAFYECTALTYVSMGSSLQDIGSYAFANCSLLVTIEIGESVRNIGSYAFFNCYALANVTVSYSVETIGDYSFCNCTALPSIYIPSNVKNIGIYAFADCSRLKAVDFSEGLQCIGGAAFYGCALEELEIPDSVVKIDSYCYNSQYGWYYGTFENCKKLKKVVIGDGAKYIDCAAFRNCTALLEVEIGNSVLEIRKDAFYGCTPLMKVTLGESVETIGSYAFAKCGSLVNINIPTSTKTIGDYAFWDCAFDTIYITYGVTRIGAYAFLECNNLRTLGIGDHVIIIDTGAFSGCTALQHTYIPFSVQSIRDRAFEYCTALESITIERGNLKTIGENIFYGCTNIERIYYKGDEYDWELISINSNNGYPLTVTPYYYRENEPAGDDIGNYWYYNAAGVEKIWNINKDGFYANEYADEVNELYVGVTFWPEYVYDYFKKDIAFKETIAFWESIHVATDPSHLLDAGWISKESIYEIALFDILIASNDDVSPLLKLCDSSTVGNVEAFIDQYFNGKAPEVAELIVGINGVMKYKYFPEEEGKTIEKLCDKVGIVEDVGEALLFVARYCAVRDMGENYISILNAIYADTSNPKDLRMAALNMIDIIESSFGEILLQILDGTIHDAITDVIFEKIVDKVWGTVLNAVGLGALQVVGKGILILGNAVFNMDGIIQSYYTLGVAVNIGLALEKLIVDYEPDYLRCENWSAASQYVDLVSMYENILLKQCDYGKGMTNLKDESLEKMDLQKKLLSDSYVEVKQRVDEKYAAYYP